jgi:beta-lactamase regulating signal transducer with metallopeptidase domain
VSDPAAYLVLWLLTWLLHSSLLYGAAWLVDRLRLLRAPAAREHLWRAAMLGALLTAGVQAAGLADDVPLRAMLATPGPACALRPAAPSLVCATPAPAPDAAVTQAAGVAQESSPAPDVAPDSAPDSAPVAAPASGTRAPSSALADSGWTGTLWPRALLALWLAGACVTALRLGARGWLARRELGERVPASGALADEWERLCATQRVARPPLTIAPALAGPVSLPNGEVALPPWAADGLHVRQRRALLAHELAHQVRRDPQWLVLGVALQALLWLQPLHRLARARLAALAELQADAWAARAVGDPRALAECLATCAERFADSRAAALGSAMTRGSLLVERVERLLDGQPACPRASWTVRAGVAGALVAAALLLPGCDMGAVHFGGSSTTVSIGADGDEVRIAVDRPGYAVNVVADGKVVFLDDESDVERLEPGARFKLVESIGGVERDYRATADAAGAVSRTLRRDGVIVPLDEESRRWLAAALPRVFRESGYDAEARVERLLAGGGPSAVLAEVDLMPTDYGKGVYLRMLLKQAALDAEQTGLVLDAASRISSSHELGQALDLLLDSPALDGPRFLQLLRVAGAIDSNHERAEILVAASGRLPPGSDVRAAWLAAAAGIQSDHDLGRTLDAGLRRARGDAAFTAGLLAFAAEHIESDFGLRSLLEEVADRGDDPAVASAYLAATRSLASDFEKRSALLELLDDATLDAAGLAALLEVAATIRSDHDRGEVLKELAERVADDEALAHAYSEAASTMGDHERAAALLELDKARR